MTDPANPTPAPGGLLPLEALQNARTQVAALREMAYDLYCTLPGSLEQIDSAIAALATPPAQPAGVSEARIAALERVLEAAELQLFYHPDDTIERLAAAIAASKETL